VHALDERDLNGSAVGVQSTVEGQILGGIPDRDSFDTDGRYVTYAAESGVYVHDLGPNGTALALTSPVALTAPTEQRVSDANVELCPATAPKVKRGVVIWCQLVSGEPRVLRSRISNLGNPGDGADDVRVIEQISGADPVAATTTSI